MSSTLPRVNNDPRSIHFNQAIEMTYGGFPMESGPAGYGLAIPAAPATKFWLRIPTHEDQTLKFSIPSGLYFPAGVAGIGSTVVKGAFGNPTASLYLKDDDMPLVVLHSSAPPAPGVAGADLPIGGGLTEPVPFEGQLKFDNDALARQRTLYCEVKNANPSAGFKNFAIVGFDFTIVPSAWK